MNPALCTATITFLRRSERIGIARSKVLLAMASKPEHPWTYNQIATLTKLSDAHLRNASMLRYLITEKLVDRSSTPNPDGRHPTLIFQLTPEGKNLAASIIT